MRRSCAATLRMLRAGRGRDPLVEQLKTGKTAIFIIFQTEEAGIGIPISLAGFKEALDDLK